MCSDRQNASGALKLEREPMPERNDGAAPVAEPHSAPRSPVGSLTMAEAKRELALMFNVSPEAIEITIRG